MTSEGQSETQQLELRPEGREEEKTQNFPEEPLSDNSPQACLVEDSYGEARSNYSPQGCQVEDPYGEGEEPSEEPFVEPFEELPQGKTSPRSEDEEEASINAAKQEWQEVQPQSSNNNETVPIPWWAGAFGACPDVKDGAEARGFYVRRFCELFFPDDTAGATEVSQG